MPQYFLKGWISAYPGEGLMKFNLPQGVTGATWDIHLQDASDAESISFDSGYTEPENNDLMNNSPKTPSYAWVGWNNQKDGDIFFDYEITPLYSSPDEEQPVALEPEGQVISGD